MKRGLLVVLVLMLIVGVWPAAAQDVVQVELDKAIQYTFPDENSQFFGQFTAKKGDLVVLTAAYNNFVIGTLELEIRDAVGRSMGINSDYVFKKFVLADIPSDGTYTVVVTSEKAEAVWRNRVIWTLMERSLPCPRKHRLSSWD